MQQKNRERLPIKFAAIDVDGTLTERRGSLQFSLEAVVALRVLKCLGVRVSLVSGNSLPVVAGLSTYLGADIAIGENGCLALLETEELHICRSRPPRQLIEELLALGFREAWQNRFRVYDIAFYPPEKNFEIALSKAKTIVSEHGFKATWSGYALHVYPAEGGKEKGVNAVLEKLNLRWDDVLAIGDGDNDTTMLAKARLSITLSDASDLAKRASAKVVRKSGGAGVLEAVLELVDFRGCSEALTECLDVQRLANSDF
ncbi:MAG: phosphoglycolate phosphatase [Acidilobaceae archaeon]